MAALRPESPLFLEPRATVWRSHDPRVCAAEAKQFPPRLLTWRNLNKPTGEGACFVAFTVLIFLLRSGRSVVRVYSFLPQIAFTVLDSVVSSDEAVATGILCLFPDVAESTINFWGIV